MGTLVTPEELKEHALSFLQKNRLMVLGTSANNKMWSATLHYAVTDEFEIIFFSRSDTRHGEYIDKNPQVSVVVTKSPKNGKDTSMQMSGIARRADGVEWNKYYPIFEKKVKEAKEHPDNIIYVIKPEEVWLISDELDLYNRAQVI